MSADPIPPAGYLRLFEQYETLHRAALALLESADDQEHPDDGFPIAEWLDLVEAVRASSPEISPQDAGLEPIETDWAFKKESAPAKSQVPPPPIAKRGGWQPTARGPAPTEPPPKPSNPAISPEEQT